jgi:hypothetical protein
VDLTATRVCAKIRAVPELPSDLQPIPTQPWGERPDSLPLVIEEVRTALWLESGSIPKAAIRLKVAPSRLRRFINNSPRLLAEQNEAREQLVDKAEENIKDALWDPIDSARRDSMSKYVASSLGRLRGYGTGPGKQININSEGGNILIQWADGTPLSNDDNDSSIIEGEMANES